MPRVQKHPKEIIEGLLAEQAALQRQLDELTTARTSLRFRAHLLGTWCDSLQYDLCSLSGQQLCVSETFASAEKLEVLQQQEHQLLQQLLELDCDTEAAPRFFRAYSQRFMLGAEPAPESSLRGLISPPEDPMRYLRSLLARPPVDEVRQWSGLQLAQLHSTLFQQLAVQLHLLDVPSQETRAAALDRITTLLDRHCHIMASLVKLRRGDLIEARKMYSLDTLQPFHPDSPLAGDRTEVIASTIIPLLKLKQQQLDAISAGADVADAFVLPLVKEWRQLQQQLDKSVNSASSSGSSRSANNGQSSVASTGRAVGVSTADNNNTAGESTVSDREKLVEQQQLQARLELVMRKIHHMVMVLTGWCVGWMTWPQLARVMVLSWPCVANMVNVARGIRLYRARRSKRD